MIRMPVLISRFGRRSARSDRLCDAEWVVLDGHRVVSASRRVQAGRDTVFELVADPSQHARWDGNGNLAGAPVGQRVTSVGDVFVVTLTAGSVRENHVVEFEEGRCIAWMPAEPGGAPIGHVWRWQIDDVDSAGVMVTHTYDWSNLHDEARHDRARWTTSERLAASIDRLGALAQRR